ncbi:MAG TPA: hypothetical protein DCM51_05335 [Actinobacteria bacterium]|nr:hypothetical protein [Actinomycetota bacterium]
MRARHLVVAATLVGLIAGSVLPAQASTKGRKKQVDRQVGAAYDDLQESSQAVRDAAAALAELRDQLPKAQRELADAQNREQTLRAALAAAKAKVQQQQDRIDAVETKLAVTQRSMHLIIRQVYAQGPYGDIEVVLNAKDPSQFASALASVRTVVRNQNRTLIDLRAQQAELQAVKADLDRTRAQVAKQEAAAVVQRQRAQAAKSRIRALEIRRNRALRSAAAEKSRALSQYNALRAEQRRLAALLSGRGDGSAYPSGSLQWPSDGPVTQGVGPRIHPVYGYRSCHTGIDIGSGYGAAIRAAASGRVIERTSGGPYGNRTLIDHGGGLATMYAHQSRVLVSVGDEVSKGEVIGYVGATGWATGPHLHFEVWISGQPYNPMGWFGGSRSPVKC